MRAIGMDPDARGAQSELGRATGTPQSTISRWLAGEVQPGIPALRDLARVLRVRPIDAVIAAGRLEPADIAGTPRTAEEHIRAAPDLSERERAELLGYLAAMRNRTGYSAPGQPQEDAASDEGEGESRTGTG